MSHLPVQVVGLAGLTPASGYSQVRCRTFPAFTQGLVSSASGPLWTGRDLNPRGARDYEPPARSVCTSPTAYRLRHTKCISQRHSRSPLILRAGGLPIHPFNLMYAGIERADEPT